jgi:hypothetical protein
MDVWLAGDDPWLARSALLHMNRWNGAIDADWLVAACLARAGNTDFFIRKAVGWALREYSKVDEAAVVAFVGAHERELSGLSRREPRMWLERRRRCLGRQGGSRDPFRRPSPTPWAPRAARCEWSQAWAADRGWSGSA